MTNKQSPLIKKSSIGQTQDRLNHLRHSEALPKKLKKKMSLGDVVREMNKREVQKHETIYIFDWDDTILCTSIIE